MVAALTVMALGGLVSATPQRLQTAGEVDRDLLAAERLLQQQKADEAKAAFAAIIEPARRLALDEQEAAAHCGVGEAWSLKTDYLRAQESLQQCLAIYERLLIDDGIGRANAALSQAAEISGRYAEAAALADRAMTAYEASGNLRGRSIATLQRLKLRDVSFADRQKLYERVVDDARRLGDPRIEGQALHSWGDRLFLENRFEEALVKLTGAADVLHAAGLFGLEGTVFNSVGRVYRAHGRLDEALRFQRQALDVHQKHGTRFELMQSHNAVAAVHQMLGHLASARGHYEQALALAEQSSSPRIQDFLRANIAGLLLDEDQFAKGARALEEVIARGIDPYPSTRRSQLSFAYLKLGRPQDALASADRALDGCGTERAECVSALDHRAAAHAALKDNDRALADVRAALSMIEGLRAKLVPTDFLKQNFHQRQQDVYSRAIAIGLGQHQARESLETAEMARSRAFLDLLAARDVHLDDRPLEPTLTFRGAPAPNPTGELQSPVLARPANAADLTAIASRLRSTLVVYWVADDELFVWVVNRDGRVASRRVNVSRPRLTELVAGTTRFQRQMPAQPWRDLYDVLIAPIRELLPRARGSLLTIVPHGSLLNLSFAALQNRGGRYLLEDYTLHYAPAGAVLQFTGARRHPDGRAGHVLLVADPSLGPRSPLDPPLPPLPGARREVRRIARLVPRARVTLLEGRAATEPRVRAAAEGKAIVHFATHAIVRDEDPSGSYLAFAPGDESGTSDGLLTARAAYGLQLSADLVVLSACRSGGGAITGDGIATFARAFMYAGTPSVVISLWDVADAPTSRLLPAFYRTWFGGASKARSLRRAQLQLLANLRAGTVRVETRAGTVTLPEHPMFWAGFILMGEPD
jgi:CHAT domain-containing protein